MLIQIKAPGKCPCDPDGRIESSVVERLFMELDSPDARLGLMDLLRHPCHSMIRTIDETGCRFDIVYDDQNPFCRECRHGAKCRWLGSHDALRSLHRIAANDLLDALRFARGIIATRVEPDHNPQACACEDCRWLRRGRRFLLNLGQSPF